MALEADANHLVGERKLTVRPHLFVGDNYAYWKTRMKLFIQANDYEAWRVRDEKIVKDENEWDANDLNMAQLNAKAMQTLFCVLGANE